MCVEISKENDKLFAFLSGEIDHHVAKIIRVKIDNELETKNFKELYLDFSKVSFMDSSGIGLVMGRYKLMCELSGKVYVQNPPGPIKKVMQIAGINRLAKIIESSEKNVERKDENEESEA